MIENFFQKNKYRKILKAIFTIAIPGILFFFSGCEKRQAEKLTPDMNSVEDSWVRVLLINDTNSFDIVCKSGLTIKNAEQRENTLFFADNSKCSVNYDSNSYSIGGSVMDCNDLVIHPNEPYVLNINGQPYRGNFKIIGNEDSKTFDVINHVPLEPYLAGVVGAEMPSYWEPEALKVQAITCRTYCLYIKERFGEGRHYDLSKTQANQVYLGVKAENKQIWDAVNNTKGGVLTVEQEGKRDIFPTYYSAVCGGHTEDAEHVFGESVIPLHGVKCPYCKKVAKPKSFFWPKYEIEKQKAKRKLFARYESLKELVDINDIKIISRTDHGNYSRITKIKLIGTNGKSDFLRAEDFRLCLDSSGQKIKSTIFKLRETEDKLIFYDGRGWGHGVGLCQCGAQYLARTGKTAEEILYYYFPGAKIDRIFYKE